MGFWIFMLFMDMLVPVALLFLGRLFLKNVSREINASFGYRTNMSMKNQDTWEFAHRYCGKLWYRAGIVLLPGSAAVMACVMDKDAAVVSAVGLLLCLVQMVPVLGAIFPTEMALRKSFDADGHPR